MSFDKVKLYFMSGTGNSYKVAAWIAEVAAQSAIETAIQPMDEVEGVVNEKGDLIILTYPTHGFTAPWQVMKFAACLPAGKGGNAAVFPTRAGTRIKGLSLPGMEGTAAYLIALLLWVKGYSIRAIAAIDMPSNWTAAHWGLSPSNVEVIVTAAKLKVQRLSTAILTGRQCFRGFIPLAIGIWLLPVSFMYLIMAQFMLAKTFFASHQCTGCGLCSKMCPRNAIQMAGEQARPYWKYTCDSCMRCMNFCPQHAIEASPIYLILFFYITSVPVAEYVLNWGATAILPKVVLSPVATFLQYAYSLLAVFLAYLLLHSFTNRRVLAFINAKLSHTYYMRRYRAPRVSLKDITGNSLKINKE